MTEEEKKQRLEELRAKMAEKRSKKAIEDAKENKINEALRRKAGKVIYLFLAVFVWSDIRLQPRTWGKSKKK